MWVDNLNPVLFQLGSLEVRWYGLVYVLGFFLAVGWLSYWRKKGKLGLSKEQVWDLMFYLMVGVLAGARIFEVFWEPGIYLARPWELLYVWRGGMSFHGGLAGIIVAGYWYCKKKKGDLGRIADMVAVPAIFALALGRVANFVNGELVGRAFNGKWCVVFPSYDEVCRHPSTLYGAGKRFLVFGWLLWLSFKEEMFRFKAGFIFWNFVFFEGAGRIIVDFYRLDELYWGFSLGQWMSLVMVGGALLVLVKYYKRDWGKLIKNIKEE